MLLTVKSNQKPLCRQIGCQFQAKRHNRFTAADHEKRHGLDTVCELPAREAPEHINANWRGSARIVEVIIDTDKQTRKAERNVRRHLFLTSVSTTPEALLRLVRKRWNIENEWHWARDAHLGEVAHRYSNRIGAPVFAFFRMIVKNLLRRGGYPLDLPGIAGGGLRHQGNAGAGWCDICWERTLITLLGTPVFSFTRVCPDEVTALADLVIRCRTRDEAPTFRFQLDLLSEALLVGFYKWCVDWGQKRAPQR